MLSDEQTKKLELNPGDPLFIDHARALHSSGSSKEAVFVCLKGLSKNPNLIQGRLLISKIYFDLGFTPFALRELELIHEISPDNDSVKRLIEIISPGTIEALKQRTSKSSSEKVLAEGSFNIKDIE